LWTLLAAVGVAAVLARPGASGWDLLPVAAGYLTWAAVHLALVNPIDKERRSPELASRERRVFLLVAGVVAVSAAGIAVAGRVVGTSRRHVEQSRRLLRIDGVTRREAPAAASLD